MKQIILFALISVSLYSCKENDPTKEQVEVVADDKSESTATTKNGEVKSNSTNIEDEVKTSEKGDVDVIDGMYYEYYPGIGKKVKFKGLQDENGKRDGKWLYFSEDGKELSVTNYIHGERNGMSMVKYPNGNLHYTGEYKNDKTVGVWTTYSIEGVKTSEKDYGNGK
ncbi:MAG TPA: hypothetical protein EYG86_03930 [Crocinitomicaceae bacterium]|nr:hypothetical protein [Crocinitomicaceae bacterium]